MSFKTAYVTLASAVATGGTFTVPYPAGTAAGSFDASAKHKLSALQTLFEAPTSFTVAFGGSNITVTYNGATTIPANTTVGVQFDMIGADAIGPVPVDNVYPANVFVVDLGAPATADADGVCASQAITALAGGTINGALAAGGVATFDVPRNVVAAWTGTAVVTVTGTDVNGETVVESSGSGTSLAGKKAFKTITEVATSADITSATVGTGDVFGLPCRLPDTGYIIKELQDGAAATAGTAVAGIAAKSTATTGDVRGTYDPNAAADGAKGFKLIVAGADPSDIGVPQYGG